MSDQLSGGALAAALGGGMPGGQGAPAPGGMPGGPMPGGPGGAPGGQPTDQVQIEFKPSPDGSSILMLVSAPDGAADFQLSLETATGILISLTQVIGQMTGVDTSEAFSELLGGTGAGLGGVGGSGPAVQPGSTLG